MLDMKNSPKCRSGTEKVKTRGVDEEVLLRFWL